MFAHRALVRGARRLRAHAHLPLLNLRGCDPKNNPKFDPLTEVKKGIRKNSCAA
jgi:hypothetical protein